MSGSATVLGGYAYPTPVSWGHLHLHVFSVDQNRSIVGKWRSVPSPGKEVWYPSDSSYEYMGGCISSSEPFIAANTRGFGYVDIFFSGCNHTLWHKGWDSEWHPSTTGYEDLDGSLTSSPTIVSWSKDRRDVFAIGSPLGVGLYQAYTDSSVWTWSSSFGGNWLAFAPTVVSWAKGRLDVFLVGNDKALHYKYYDGDGWVPPSAGIFDNLGGYCTSRPVAISRSTGKIDIFVRGGDSGLWHLSYDSNVGWTNWTSISSSTAIQAEPDAVSWGPDRIDVFAWGATDRALLHKSFNGTMWVPQDGFENLGGDLSGPPKAVCDIEESVNVFAFGRYGNLLRKAWNQTQGQWTPKNSFQDLGTP
ncbi:MAG: hypothetical protein M1813_009123 [Trichoglossum hirsutum]|nr:MAG: hypothetical protein M1813_009123 [Trichoglossum hirsutum]